MSVGRFVVVDSGRSYLFVTDDLEEARQWCARYVALVNEPGARRAGNLHREAHVTTLAGALASDAW